MAWKCFWYFGKSDLVFLFERVNAKKYIATLGTKLFLSAALNFGERRKFQQDNAPIHTAPKLKQYCSGKPVNVIAWPAKNPDLSPIEKNWSILVKSVYAKSKQFSSVGELKTELIRCWQNIVEKVL